MKHTVCLECFRYTDNSRHIVHCAAGPLQHDAVAAVAKQLCGESSDDGNTACEKCTAEAADVIETITETIDASSLESDTGWVTRRPEAAQLLTLHQYLTETTFELRDPDGRAVHTLVVRRTKGDSYGLFSADGRLRLVYGKWHLATTVEDADGLPYMTAIQTARTSLGG